MSPLRELLPLRSLSARLAALFCGATVLLLTATAGAMYLVLQRNLDRQAELFVSDKIEVLRAILERQPGQIGPLKEEVQWEAATRQESRYFSRVVLGGGGSLETPGMADALGAAPFPPPTPAGRPWRGGRLWDAGGERYFLLGSALAAQGTLGDQRPLIQVALDVSREMDVLEDYRTSMAIALLAGAVLSAAAGLWVARRGLRPIQSMTRAVCAVTPDRLQTRVSAGDWPAELKDLASAFDDMLVRLEEAFQRLSTFSADLAHDLRTPLGNCIGEVEVALAKPRDEAEYRRVLESSMEDLGRLARMVDSLLFLARAQSAEARPSCVWIDAAAVTGEVADLFDALAEEGGVSLTTSGTGQVWADPTLLRRAVSNLLANAIAHTPRDGSVEVRLEAASAGSLRLTVEDTGSGIPPEEVQRLFDRFYRGVSSRIRHPQGLGLGLAIVKSIMDMHGGTVDVASTPGKGTQVSLAFPPPA